jgi:hypothetical protein
MPFFLKVAVNHETVSGGGAHCRNNCGFFEGISVEVDAATTGEFDGMDTTGVNVKEIRGGLTERSEIDEFSRFTGVTGFAPAETEKAEDCRGFFEDANDSVAVFRVARERVVNGIRSDPTGLGDVYMHSPMRHSNPWLPYVNNIAGCFELFHGEGDETGVESHREAESRSIEIEEIFVLIGDVVGDMDDTGVETCTWRGRLLPLCPSNSLFPWLIISCTGFFF